MTSAPPVQPRGGGYGLDKELAKAACEKYDPELEKAAQKWIENVLQEPFPHDVSFGAALKDGQILVRFINAIHEGTVKKVETSTIPFKQMENVSNFIKSCRSWGVAEFDLFQTTDLYEQKDLRVVVNCILALARAIKTSVPSFQGPFPTVEVSHPRGKSLEGNPIASLTHAMASNCKVQATMSATAQKKAEEDHHSHRSAIDHQQQEQRVVARGGGYGLDAELAALREAKYDHGLEAEIRQWIEAVLREPFPDPSFVNSLKDGQILCRFINTIKPGTVKKIETSKMPFKQMENITNFIRGCRTLGVPEPDLFETIDLFELKDLSVVVRCCDSLGRVVQKTVPEFSGPHQGARLAEENRRQFDSQLQRSVAATKLGMGSAPTMERLGFDKSMSVTFRAENAGDMLYDGATQQTIGDAGLMERLHIDKSNNITFGAESASAGTTGA